MNDNNDNVITALDYFKKMYPHYDMVRHGTLHLSDDGTLAITPVVYRYGLSFSLALVVAGMSRYRGIIHWDMAAVDTKLQHIGNDWDLAQVEYFFDQEGGFSDIACFAVGVMNDTTEGSGVEGDILLVDPSTNIVVSAVARACNYARVGAFKGATVVLTNTDTGWGEDSSAQITCTNGCRYSVESAGYGTFLSEASWQADI